MPDEVTLHTAEAARLPAINMAGYSPAQHVLGSCGNWTALTFPSVIASSGAISGKCFPQPKQHIKSAIVGWQMSVVGFMSDIMCQALVSIVRVLVCENVRGYIYHSFIHSFVLSFPYPCYIHLMIIIILSSNHIILYICMCFLHLYHFHDCLTL